MGERSTGARILLADDLEPYRRAIRSILANDPCIELAGEAADGAEAELASALARRHREGRLTREERDRLIAAMERDLASIPFS